MVEEGIELLKCISVSKGTKYVDILPIKLTMNVFWPGKRTGACLHGSEALFGFVIFCFDYLQSHFFSELFMLFL